MKSGLPLWRKLPSSSFCAPAKTKVTPRNARRNRIDHGITIHDEAGPSPWCRALRDAEVPVAVRAPAMAASTPSGRSGGAVLVRIQTSMRGARLGEGFTTVGKRLEPRAATCRPGTIARMRIVLIEDDRRLAQLLATRLRPEGHA